MKSASSNAIKHVVTWLAGGALTPCLSAAQIPSPGDLDPAGRVYTEIVARVGEQGSNSPPIAGLTVYVVSEGGNRVTMRTTLGGTAATWLGSARYRIVTPEPYQFEGRMYTWDTIAVVRPGMALIRLQLSNARSRPVPVVTWRQGDGSSGETLKDGHVVRTLTRDGVAISATVSRTDDLMWADVSISNGSNRKLQVDPQTFVLNELSPKQASLGYRLPTEIPRGMTRRSRIDVNRALVANTLMPGQNITGVVYFGRDKAAREVMLRIPLSGVTFDLPFSIR